MTKNIFYRTAAFTMAAVFTTQLLSPISQRQAAAETSTGGNKMSTLTTYESYLLSDVTVTDSYLKNAEEKDIAYLLSLDADRLLAGFRETAGLSTMGKSRYSGWETSLIAGHTLGHYLTAVAQAVASLPDSDSDKAELNDRLSYLIVSLKECQDAIGTGFLFGATLISKSNIELQFDNVESNKTNITSEAWVPWYTMHKILAGILDVYKYTGNETALTVAKGLGDWVYRRTSSWSASTRRTVLNIEYGGMNDCLYELYAATGEDRYAVAAHAFDDETLFKSISSGEKNVLNNRHANTTIPKFIGALKRYVTTHGKIIEGTLVDASAYLTYAQDFFSMVLERHTYITGDNSEWEHFGADYILDAERTNCNCETCNAYNMLKFAKELFLATGDVSYLNYYENTFYNTILSSQDPDSGMTTYFQPMASGYFKVYTTPYQSFWCCTGSGMENFTKLGNAIYYSGSDSIVISQYLSSVLTDNEKNIQLTMTADIPASETICLTVSALDGRESITEVLAFRLPDWLSAPAVLLVNGAPATTETKDGFLLVSGLKDHDMIELTLPMQVTAHSLPDNDSVFAFRYGPIVLSAKLGTKDMTTTYTGVSVLIPAAKYIEETYISNGSDTISILEGSVTDFMQNINSHLTRVEGSLAWELQDTDATLTFVPHYSQHTERYGIYFSYESNADAFHVARYLKAKEEARFSNALLGTVQPGYGQYENDVLHNMTETGSGSTGSTGQGTSRFANAGGAFTYRMKTDSSQDNVLELTLNAEDNGKPLTVTIGDTVIFQETLSYNGDSEEYTLRLPVTKDILERCTERTADGNTVIPVTFSGSESAPSARICNYLYMTKSYSRDTSAVFTLTDSDTGISYPAETLEDGSLLFRLPSSVSSASVLVTLADENGYVRVNGSVAKESYSLDLSRNNYVTLFYTVYAEDHETTASYTVSIEKDAAERSDVDPALAYFVNCGDFDVTTVTGKDLFGIYNGVTEQVYGKDPVTGMMWGIVDSVSSPLKNGTANNANMLQAVFTDNTWPFETNAALNDTSKKAQTNRYTKNQYENGIPRKLNYRFELPNGEYSVKLYFTDPWNCSKNPIVTINGEEKLTNIPVNQSVTATAQVTDGILDLVITAPESTLCINLCYILIYLPEDSAEIPEATVPPVGDETTEPTILPEATPSQDPDSLSQTEPAHTAFVFPAVLAAGAITILGTAADLFAWLKKKRKK